MSLNYECEFCNHKFSYEKSYLKHIEIHIQTQCLDKNIHKCDYCKKTYTLKQNLNRHIIKCSRKDIVQLEDKFEQKFKELQHQIMNQNQKIEIIEKDPKKINNILQVVAVGSADNYLDMLTNQVGFDRALDYIKDCALSSLTGDCKLITKIYLDSNSSNQEVSIRFADKKKTKIEYFNEKKERVQNSKELLMKKLANNLQNSYLKGVNYLITKNLEDHKCPNKFLEEYDLQIWNQHIYDLSDLRYQRNVINHLDIPIKNI